MLAPGDDVITLTLGAQDFLTDHFHLLFALVPKVYPSLFSLNIITITIRFLLNVIIYLFNEHLFAR